MSEEVEVDNINNPVESLNILGLKELQSSRDRYLVHIVKEGITIYQKSQCTSTAYEAGKERTVCYGEYESKNELLGDLPKIVEAMNRESEARVENAKTEIIEYLNKVLKKYIEEKRVRKSEYRKKLERNVETNVTDREFENALQGLQEEGLIEEVENDDENPEYRVTPEGARHEE